MSLQDKINKAQKATWLTDGIPKWKVKWIIFWSQLKARRKMRTVLDYIFCFIIKRLPPCKLERWMIRQLVTWIRK